MKRKSKKFDVAVIGAGANGLVAATALGRRGKKVVVLEARDEVGGLAASVEYHPGYRSGGVLHDTTLLRPAVVQELGLERYGLKLRAAPPKFWALGERGQRVELGGSTRDAVESVRAYAPDDADSFREMSEFLGLVRPVLAKFSDEMPVSFVDLEAAPMLDLLKRGLRVRRLGKKNMYELMRVAPMCIGDHLDEWLDDDLIKAALALPSVLATYTGPRSPGGSANLLLLAGMSGPGVVGGAHRLIAALEAAALDAGVEIRTGAAVERIEVSDARVTGVTFGDGETLDVSIVAASCDPRTALLDLIEPMHLSARLERRLKNYRCRGTTAQLLLALDKPVELDGKPVARARIASNLMEIERAFEAIKYGELPARPVLDLAVPSEADPSLCPDGHAVMSVLASFVPYDLRAGWSDETRRTLTDSILERLDEQFEGLSESVVATRLSTPVELEADFRLAGGNLHHGERAIDQVLVRPVPECATYATPIAGLFLSGGGTHPGGGLHGGCGLLAARAMS